jgi:hypothetical protein
VVEARDALPTERANPPVLPEVVEAWLAPMPALVAVEVQDGVHYYAAGERVTCDCCDVTIEPDYGYDAAGNETDWCIRARRVHVCLADAHERGIVTLMVGECCADHWRAAGRLVTPVVEHAAPARSSIEHAVSELAVLLGQGASLQALDEGLDDWA